MEKQIIVPDQIFTITNFLSKEECNVCIKISEEGGYDFAPISTSLGFVNMPTIRNNSRVMIDDVKLAERLWKRLMPFVPTPLEGKNVVGLNERFRFYRYDVGQVFASHYDGSFRRENGEESQLTFMIYLNNDFVGGETRFDLRYPHGEVDVVPQTGMALLFIHHLRHEGSRVKSGRKYVLRSDVMYSASSD